MAAVTFNAIGNGNSGAGATATVTVGAAGVPAGSLILVAVDENNGGTIGGSVTDTAGNTYTRILGQASSTFGFIALFYAWNAAALSNTNTITYTKQTSGDGAAMSAAYVTGIDTTSDPHDSAMDATATGTSSTPSVVSGTPTKTGNFTIGILGEGGATFTFTEASNWFANPSGSASNGSPAAQISTGYAVNGASTLTFNPTLGASGTWAAGITGFRPAAGVEVVNLGQQTGTTATLAVTVPAGGVPAGALICVAVAERSTTIGGSMADSASNPYTQILGEVATARGYSALFYAWNAAALAAGQTITWTKQNTTDTGAMTAFYATGIVTDKDPHDSAVDAVATGATTTPSVTSGTPADTGEFIVGILGQTAVSAYTQDTAHGFGTPPVTASLSNATPAEIDGGSQINSGASAVTFAPTIGSATQWSIGITGFRAIWPAYRVPLKTYLRR
ncbi:MAG TPA: hypothetical protein VFN27_16915 [Xanthobacteraceae bacterium]|nr:hypothetical protein [Xanthobacteraceae bacterium]